MKTVKIQLTVTECEQYHASKDINNLTLTCGTVDELSAAQTAIWNLLWGRILAEKGKEPDGDTVAF